MKAKKTVDSSFTKSSYEKLIDLFKSMDNHVYESKSLTSIDFDKHDDHARPTKSDVLSTRAKRIEFAETCSMKLPVHPIKSFKLTFDFDETTHEDKVSDRRKKQASVYKEQRRIEGRCLKCGNEGEWISMALMCPEHGKIVG